jgi:hypothetical protein
MHMRLIACWLAGLAALGPAAAGEPVFAAKPTATKDGDKIKIGFAVSAPTDVEVAILGADGKVVRHLAAGLLGKNAPEPFKKDSLAQEVVWDGNDDAGKPAVGGLFNARVRLGLQPRLDRILGRNDNTIPSAYALTVSPKGELFVFSSDTIRGGSELRVLDRDGRYLRTIMPYPANTPVERTESVGHVIIDGKRQPLVFNGQGNCLSPLVAGKIGRAHV